ncbi:unnamed protein product (macronuclear) [Paramecium tetraurelia]|uniref:VHS domain-containing protein n=1 Tax=Paramecium tetraurelia TaxID=5888 RepID=A0D0S4_PARTE|nr:uncharacterized protein GSPATT00012193001 [Paramecium tetraurelia]CAK76641.1 unnamed protein product [Paramecium tetraurelia]|eukprot:XP_001444038.1 hypothetical protein (macronuclear) [Paramecium tetraurelia strain d4-2]
MKLDEIKKCFNSENHYKQTKQIKDYILENNTQEHHQQQSEITKVAIQAVGNILEDTKSLPIQKVLSTRLVKEIMDCHIALVIEKVQIKIIPIYEQTLISYCDKGQKPKQYFSDQPDEQLMVLSNTFIRLISESVFVWNIWHPVIEGQQSAYSRVYNILVAKGLQFPKLFYFNSQKVKEFYVHSKEQMHNSPFVYSNNIQPDFFYIKKRLDVNQFQQSDLIIIRNELLCKQLRLSLLALKNSDLNSSQEKFIKNFEIAYKDFEKTQRFDELQITIQSMQIFALNFYSCLEFDDEVFDKQAAIDAFQKRFQSNQSNFTPSKLHVGAGGYSTDKISQFLSHGSMSVIHPFLLSQSQNSSPNNNQKQQLQILNEKNRRIEQLLLENSLLQKQIKNFEDQIHTLKQNLSQNNE